jgi:lysophospholipase L1-like esterase
MKNCSTRTAQTTLGSAAILLCAAINTSQAQSAAPFAVTWGAAPITEPLAEPNLTLTNQTMRQIVHTSIGGSEARLRLTNINGEKALTVRDVHLARSANNASPATVAGSDVPVTFGGSTSVTIPAGGSVASDNVNFTVVPLSDVAISMFFPGPVPTNLTVNDFAEQEQFFVNGDLSSSQDFAPLGTTGRNFFLYGLDVQQPSAAGTLVAFGASITHGDKSNGNSNHRWPNIVANRAIAAGFNVGVDNQGLSGGHSDSPPGPFGPGAVQRIGTDVLGQPGVKFMVYSDFFINDENGGDGSSPDPIIPLTTEESFLESALSKAHAQGIKAICSTPTPAGGANNRQWTNAAQTALAGYIAFINSSDSKCDAVFDQNTVMQDPTNSIQINPPFSNFDGIHPNDVGYQVLGNAFNLAALGTVPANIPLIANGTYTLVVRNSGQGNTPLVIDDPAASASPGTAQEIWTLNQGTNQHWVLTNVENNVVSLINESNGLALEVAAGSTAAAASVDQGVYTADPSQQWNIVPAGNGWFELLNAKTGQSLDVTGGSTTPGALLVQFPYHDAPWEQWSFVQ